MEGDVKSLIFSFHCLNPFVFGYELCHLHLPPFP
uniref:Uncharacterized protein n=1 Tax=Anguilla anguilla TaxID=7936 RepID=A0A0E9TRI1_ANGAN